MQMVDKILATTYSIQMRILDLETRIMIINITRN